MQCKNNKSKCGQSASLFLFNVRRTVTRLYCCECHAARHNVGTWPLHTHITCGASASVYFVSSLAFFAAASPWPATNSTMWGCLATASMNSENGANASNVSIRYTTATAGHEHT